ncbi:flagellar biosynthetic protein FliR [Anaerovorax odorimutans]|uniref:flagellar biosynthetic protein FliR n=1 Tax=Anaerovorax odorimutans TaxID=109327 RepID=UPI000426C235|nr:flagellar biosynthetic protein FliR [Anaerovorax odorimutans]
MFGIEDWIIFTLVLMRMAGCILFNPILGRRNFPAMFKIGLTLVLSLVIYTYSDISITEFSTTVEYIILLLKEFFIGYVLGFIVSLFAYIIIFGGELIDLQMGIAMSKIYDPQSNISMSLTGTYYNILFTFLFFVGNGHLTLIKLFLNLGEFIPYGKVIINTKVPSLILDVFCQCTVLAVKLAMPIVAIEFLLEIAVGILMKAIPQINVFVINIQAKLFIGLILLVILFSPMVSFMEYLIELLFDSMEQMVIIMGQG